MKSTLIPFDKEEKKNLVFNFSLFLAPPLQKEKKIKNKNTKERKERK